MCRKNNKMKKTINNILKKIGITLILISQIISILSGLNISYAKLNEGDNILLQPDHECDSLLEYWMSDYNKWSYKVIWYVYYIDKDTNEKYPAFCVEPQNKRSRYRIWCI